MIGHKNWTRWTAVGVAGSLAAAVALGGSAGPMASFELKLDGAVPRAGVPVQASLDGVTDRSAAELDLFAVDGDSRTEVPFQVADEGPRTIHWLVTPEYQADDVLVFELVDGDGSPDRQFVQAVQGEDVLVLRAGQRQLLGYQFGIMPAPEGTNPLYQRSAFIHPLWSPRGQVLTQIQPADHYHHYGIWNPWTHVLFEGEEVDFWNLAKGEGTVRFAGFKSGSEGPVFGQYAARHEHVVSKDDGSEKVALNELQSVRVYRPVGGDAFIADVTIALECAGDSPFRILEYRYAGFGWRATEEWNNENSSVLTSEGMTRVDADGTTARWYRIQGEVGGDHAGVVIMSHPDNFNHPEPLRIWPPETHEGAVFAMFAPTKNTDWLLEPGNTYVLKYRMLVFNGEVDLGQADAAWEVYGEGPRVRVTTR